MRLRRGAQIEHDLLRQQQSRPGGGAQSASGVMAGSGLNTTAWCVKPALRSSRRMTRANGQPLVWLMSQSSNRLASSLLPVPSADTMGMPRTCAVRIRSTLQDTRSMQSAM